MSNAKEFEERVRNDEELQKRLKDALSAYGGTDGGDEREVFDAVIAPLAAEIGLPLTYEEALENAKGGIELTLDELDATTGSNCERCFIFGWINDVDATICVNMGVDEGGAGACVGVGIGWW